MTAAAKRFDRYDVAGLLLIIEGVSLAMLPRIMGMFQSLWYDEAFTAAISRLPLDRLLTATAGDVHPPLFYIIEHAFIAHLGDAEVVLRLPSFVCGLAAILLMDSLADAMGLQRHKLAAVQLMLFAPFQWWFGNEARMYMLVQVAAMLAAWGVYSRRWWLYAGGATIGLWSHNLFALYLVPLGLIGLWRERAAPRAFILGSVAALAAWLPWAAVLVHQVGGVAGGFWVQRPTLGTPAYTIHMMIWGPTVPGWAGFSAAFVGLLLVWVGAVVAYRARRWDILVLAFIPLALECVISCWTPVLLWRTLTPSVPALYLVIAHAFDSRRRAAALAALAVPLVVVAGWGYVSGATGREPARQWVAGLDSLEDGDVIFHGNLASYMLYSYYLPAAHHVVWRQANDLSQSLTRETKDAMGLPEGSIEELNARRVWVVWAQNPTTAPTEYDYITAALAKYGAREVAIIKRDDVVDARLYLIEGNDE